MRSATPEWCRRVRSMPIRTPTGISANDQNAGLSGRPSLRPKPSGTSSTVRIAYCIVPHNIGLSARRPGLLAARQRPARMTAVAVHTASSSGSRTA